MAKKTEEKKTRQRTPEIQRIVKILERAEKAVKRLEYEGVLVDYPNLAGLAYLTNLVGQTQEMANQGYTFPPRARKASTTFDEGTPVKIKDEYVLKYAGTYSEIELHSMKVLSDDPITKSYMVATDERFMVVKRRHLESR